MDNDQGKLFIGGISWETSEEKLKEYFSSYGEVIETVIMKDRTTGRARGFGFVAFADPAVADTALLEKHTIDGRVVEAKKAVPRDEQHKPSWSSNGGPRTKKIFVGGLAASVTEEDFKNYFGQFGSITDAVVMYDHSTQRPRGFGFITFSSEDAVDNVLQKNFHELNEKMVEVKPAVPKEMSVPGGRNPGGGFMGATGRGASFNGGYGQGYNSSPGNTYGARMDNRYVAQPAVRGGYPSYGPGGYGTPSYGSTGGYGPAMNGGYGASGYSGGAGYGGTGSYGGGYGSTPAATGYGTAGGYGTAAAPGGYGTAPSGPRSPWGSAGGGYPSGGSPAAFTTNNGGMSGYGSTGWGAGGTSGQASGGSAGYGGGGYGYGMPEAGYVSNAAGYGARGGGYASGPTGGASGYGDSYGASGYQDNGWRSAPDSHSSPAAGPGPAAGGYGIGGGVPTAEGYGGTGRQTQLGPDARFRPYPPAAERAA